MALKIMGSSFHKEFVYCYHCGKTFVWLKAYSDGQGGYIPKCRKCRLKEEKEMKKDE